MRTAMTLDLLATRHVRDDDVAAVVDAYVADPGVGSVGIGVGYRIDPAAAVAAHPFADTLIGRPRASAELRRAAVRAAVLLARPERVAEHYDGRIEMLRYRHLLQARERAADLRQDAPGPRVVA